MTDVVMPETIQESSVTVTGTLTVTPVSANQARLAVLDPAAWTPADFRAYVSEEIERLHGPQLPCRRADDILNGFFDRHGPAGAVFISRHVFEVLGGMWMGAPVTVRRFTESNDEFFARAILADTGASVPVS